VQVCKEHKLCAFLFLAEDNDGLLRLLRAFLGVATFLGGGKNDMDVTSSGVINIGVV